MIFIGITVWKNQHPVDYITFQNYVRHSISTMNTHCKYYWNITLYVCSQIYNFLLKIVFIKNILFSYQRFIIFFILFFVRFRWYDNLNLVKYILHDLTIAIHSTLILIYYWLNRIIQFIFFIYLFIQFTIYVQYIIYIMYKKKKKLKNSIVNLVCKHNISLHCVMFLLLWNYNFNTSG